jgi:hypothetical protein
MARQEQELGQPSHCPTLTGAITPAGEGRKKPTDTHTHTHAQNVSQSVSSPDRPPQPDILIVYARSSVN